MASLNSSSGTTSADPVDSLRLVCISTDVYASAALQATVSAIVPRARVDAADTSIVRGTPDAECVIVAVGAMYSAGVALVRELRARGFTGSIILVVESPDRVLGDELTQLGIGAVLPQSTLAERLPEALTSVLQLEAQASRSAPAAAMLSSLRRVQKMVAAGELAGRLQHKLNNPLAALLAEAQLLELEELPSDHATSVRRIVELCRRVIEVTKSIEGMGGSAGI
jgi:signal transduction histidine kinase